MADTDKLNIDSIIARLLEGKFGHPKRYVITFHLYVEFFEKKYDCFL